MEEEYDAEKNSGFCLRNNHTISFDNENIYYFQLMHNQIFQTF